MSTAVDKKGRWTDILVEANMKIESQDALWEKQRLWIIGNFKKYKMKYSTCIYVIYIDGIPQVLREDFIPMSYHVMNDFLDYQYNDFRDCPDCRKRVPKKYSTTDYGTKVWAWVCSCGYESVSFCVDYK